MAFTYCAAGHYYDSEIYPNCPYCNNTKPIVDYMNQIIDTTVSAEDRGFSSIEECGKTVGCNQSQNTASVDSCGKTVPSSLQNAAFAPDDYAKTIAAAGLPATETVVGWLVCIQGPHKGQDFRLHYRNNTIGRSADNDVVLSKDGAVSHRRHAIIDCEPVTNRFFINKEQNYVYMQQTSIRQEVELHAYDVFTVGASTMLFVPLCGDKFSWSQDGAADTVQG